MDTSQFSLNTTAVSGKVLMLERNKKQRTKNECSVYRVLSTFAELSKNIV